MLGLGGETILAAGTVAAGIALLYVGAEALVKGASGLTESIGLSAAVAGVTVIAFATTAPELAVVTLAGTTGGETIGLGAIVGSNAANVGLVLGVAALIRPLRVTRATVVYHLPFVVLAALLLVGLGIDGRLGPLDGVGLLVALAAFTSVLWYTRGEEQVATDGGHPTDEPDVATDESNAATDEPHTATDEPDAVADEPDAATDDGVSLRRHAAYVVAGLVALVLGARALIAGGETLMLSFGITQRLVGLTVVALGTSLPELAASVVAALRGADDFSVGNVVGSNVYNVLAVLGVSLLFAPTRVPAPMITTDFPFLLGVTGLLAVVLLVHRRVGRPAGFCLLASYLAYVLFVL